MCENARREVWNFRLSKSPSTATDSVLKIAPCVAFENGFPEDLLIDLSPDQGKSWFLGYQVGPGEALPAFTSPLAPISACVARFRIGKYHSNQLFLMPSLSKETSKVTISIISQTGHTSRLNVEVTPDGSATMKIVVYPTLWLTNISVRLRIAPTDKYHC
jgi:hypothetical protein